MSISTDTLLFAILLVLVGRGDAPLFSYSSDPVVNIGLLLGSAVLFIKLLWTFVDVQDSMEQRETGD